MAGLRTNEFSLINMKETFDDASEALFEAVQKQNPVVDFDQFDMELRQLVMRYGRGGYSSSLAEVTASLENTAPVYIEAGDILVLARQAWASKQYEESLKMFATAMEADGIDELTEAISINNRKSEIGEITAASKDNTEEDSEDDSEEDSKDNLDGASEEDEDIVDDDTSVDDAPDEDDEIDSALENTIANLASLAEDNDNSSKENSSEEDEDKDEENDDDIPMGGASSKSKEKSSNLKLAAANKISLTGTREAMIKGKRVLAA
jgi:hypothetical protein